MPKRAKASPKNTLISYMYRDGCNNKFRVDGNVIVRGAIKPSQEKRLHAALFEEEFFRHSLVGLPSAFPWDRAEGGYPYDGDIDHDLHWFDSTELTEEAPTVAMSIEELVRAFERGARRRWLERLPTRMPLAGGLSV